VNQPNKFSLKLTPTGVNSEIVVEGVPLRGVREVSVHQEAGNLPLLTLSFLITSDNFEISAEGMVRIGNAQIPEVLAKQLYLKLKHHFEEEPVNNEYFANL